MKRVSLIRFRIDFAAHCNVGPGKIELLEEIARSGSLSQAARRMGISYRRAWMLLDSLNSGFNQPPARKEEPPCSTSMKFRYGESTRRTL